MCALAADTNQFLARNHSRDAKPVEKRVRPGGRILVGEGYWKREPHPDYLAVLGGIRDDLTDHTGNIAVGEREGLTLLHASESTLEEWDQFEGLYARTVEEYAAAYPEDADSAEMSTRITRWRDAYLRWGRDTLGFGLYLFLR